MSPLRMHCEKWKLHFFNVLVDTAISSIDERLQNLGEVKDKFGVLLNFPNIKKRRGYLAVGISSVKRINGNYLITTLEYVFSKSSPEERSSMVVVVLLADFDASWRLSTVREIKTEFASELNKGQLVVIHVPQDWYPALTGLKRNLNNPPETVTSHPKQNVDYSFLINYSAGLGQYYLQLEDDITCANNFLTHIKKCIEELEATNWAMLEFSVLGYIGKLYKSAHAPLLARFLFLFHQEMRCDWLMPLFRELLTQKETIIFKPSLFQHMGTFSSFEEGYNNLKDKYFQEDGINNPEADVYSDMSIYQDKSPSQAWEGGNGFFWAQSVRQGNYLTVVLKDPAVLTGIIVETGIGEKDRLQSGQVEIGHDVVTSHNEKTCKEFQSVGTFKNGMFEMHKMDKKYTSASSCLRIQLTAGQKSWLIIKNILVTTL
uniref:Mgat4 family member C n=1 Tax=Mola mola TaxID=94237 RepID=A0A3Q3XB18_MOLML